MNVIERERTTFSKKKVSVGAAGISFILHVALFLMVGTIVVTQYTVPSSPITGELTPSVLSEEIEQETPETVEQPEAPETPSEAKEESPSAAHVELSVPPLDILAVTSSNTPFKVPVSVGGIGQGEGGGDLGKAGGEAAGKSAKPKVSSPFGEEKPVGNSSLEGILYDLKQTRNGKPSNMDGGKYIAVLMEFFKKNWNRRILDDYYQVKKPLYATQIFMPMMQAAEAPKAFHVENEVQPSHWVIVYEGSFQVPESGEYRFAGYADDILVVRVNEKAILDGSRRTLGFDGTFTDSLVKVPRQEIVAEHKLSSGSTAYSEWLKLEPGQSNKIEILVGERPGGGFCAYLFVEQKGKEYQKEGTGRPILPIFRMADTETEPSTDANFDKNGPVFGLK